MTQVSSSTANGAYGLSSTISIQVAFSEVVTVTGTPQLTLETGTTDRVVDYASGSGSSTLTFTYAVQTGDTSSDLDYASTSALALNGGTICNAAGKNAYPILPAPGATGSLGANKTLVIDTTPTTISIGSPSLNSIMAGGGTVTYTVTYTDANFSASTLANADVTLNTTDGASGTVNVTGSGRRHHSGREQRRARAGGHRGAAAPEHV